MQKHGAATTTNEPIPGLAALQIALQLNRDDDEMSVLVSSSKVYDEVDPLAPVIDNSMSLNPLSALSPEEIAAEAALAIAEIFPLETDNKAPASASAVKRARSCPAQLRNPTPLAAVKKSASDLSFVSAESHDAEAKMSFGKRGPSWNLWIHFARERFAIFRALHAEDSFC
eukprot:3890408-Amphidinium_carterae.2